MPRKPRIEPIPYIEGLSGVPLPKPIEACDFTGEPIKPVVPRYAATAKRSAKEIRDERKAVDQALAQAFLDKLNKPKQVLAIPKGKHIAGTITQKDGTVKHVLEDNPPWRRM